MLRFKQQPWFGSLREAEVLVIHIHSCVDGAILLLSLWQILKVP